MTTTNGPHPALVTALAARMGKSEQDVHEFLAAHEAMQRAVPPTTVQMDPASKNVAVRTVQDGVPIWWVVDHSDGSCGREIDTPDKEWPAIFTPEEA